MCSYIGCFQQGQNNSWRCQTSGLTVGGSRCHKNYKNKFVPYYQKESNGIFSSISLGLCCSVVTFWIKKKEEEEEKGSY